MFEPNPKFKNFLSFFRDSPGRLKKYIELLTLKDKATPYATTDKKSLGEVGVVINTKCNLKCVWCHREEKHIKDSIPDSIIIIEDLRGDGDHYSATVISKSFVGKTKIEQHKMVYDSLEGKMGNELHALMLKTKTE